MWSNGPNTCEVIVWMGNIPCYLNRNETQHRKIKGLENHHGVSPFILIAVMSSHLPRQFSTEHPSPRSLRDKWGKTRRHLCFVFLWEIVSPSSDWISLMEWNNWSLPYFFHVSIFQEDAFIWVYSFNRNKYITLAIRPSGKSTWQLVTWPAASRFPLSVFVV